MSQFATFRVAGRLMGLDLLTVREILRPLAITRVPRAAPHIRGLLNLRGQVVTILDLAVFLGLPPAELTDRSHIVILKARGELPPSMRRGLAAAQRAHLNGYEGAPDVVGLLVDAIEDVVEADAGALEAPPANLTEAEGRLLSGVHRTETDLLVLLHLQDLFTHI